jgi:glycosyltransferase involved in cell wall biosynthesis
MPEVIDEGVTGYLVHDVDQAVVAVGALGMIDRAGCRARARLRYGANRMVADYVTVYERLLRGHRA